VGHLALALGGEAGRTLRLARLAHGRGLCVRPSVAHLPAARMGASADRARRDPLHAPGLRFLSLVAQPAHGMRLGRRPRRPSLAGKGSPREARRSSPSSCSATGRSTSSRTPPTCRSGRAPLPASGSDCGGRIPGTFSSKALSGSQRSRSTCAPREDSTVTGHIAFWSLVTICTVMWAAGPWTPPPPSPRALAWFALIGWLIFPGPRSRTGTVFAEDRAVPSGRDDIFP
jgi:hypothetical protein